MLVPKGLPPDGGIFSFPQKTLKPLFLEKNMLLTKSNYLSGLQCPKLLWIEKNDKGRIPKPTEVDQKKFDDGIFIGELATTLFPNGISLADKEFKENLEKTKEQLEKRLPIFEAGFIIDNLYSRADILLPVEKDKWDIIEVKSATKVKDINLHDVAFQKLVYEKAGLKIRKCFLIHINNQYTLQDALEAEDLFTKTEITEEIKPFEKDLEKNIKKMFKIITGPEPEFSINDYLTIEYPNICLNEFLESQPEESIFEFYRMAKKKQVELFKQGYKKIKEIPDSIKLSEKQLIQRNLAENKEIHTNKSEIKNFINNLEYPLYFLDFETISPIIPKFKGMKPYQRIPFQFSLHIQESENQDPKHLSFLADGTDDPRPKFMKALKDNLGEKGSIMVYNQGFEKGVLKESAEELPRFKKWLNTNILPRIKDLLDIFKNFQYYDPKQKGSASIKNVLPILSKLSYKNLKHIQKGDQASYEWERITYNSFIDKKEKAKIRKALEKYCELDTLAEVEILKGLKGIVKDE